MLGGLTYFSADQIEPKAKTQRIFLDEQPKVIGEQETVWQIASSINDKRSKLRI